MRLVAQFQPKISIPPNSSPTTRIAIGRVPLEEEIDDLLPEIHLMNALKHPNIVAFHSCYVGDVYSWIILEHYAARSALDIMMATEKSLGEIE